MLYGSTQLDSDVVVQHACWVSLCGAYGLGGIVCPTSVDHQTHVAFKRAHWFWTDVEINTKWPYDDSRCRDMIGSLHSFKASKPWLHWHVRRKFKVCQRQVRLHSRWVGSSLRTLIAYLLLTHPQRAPQVLKPRIFGLLIEIVPLHNERIKTLT